MSSLGFNLSFACIYLTFFLTSISCILLFKELLLSLSSFFSFDVIYCSVIEVLISSSIKDKTLIVIGFSYSYKVISPKSNFISFKEHSIFSPSFLFNMHMVGMHDESFFK